MPLTRFLVLVVVGLLVIVGGYLAIYKRAEVRRYSKGYKAALTPKEAAELFKKAIENRDYPEAATYTTDTFGDYLRGGGDAAREFATALDNLTYQMNERGLIRDEVRVVFLSLDPFPKDFTITIGKETEKAAEATFRFAPMPTSQTASQWKLKAEIFQAYARSVPNNKVIPMVRDEKGWKFSIPVDSGLALRVQYLKDKYKNYVNPFEIVTQEVKNDPATREDVTSRLKKLLEEAATE